MEGVEQHKDRWVFFFQKLREESISCGDTDIHLFHFIFFYFINKYMIN